jgi:hypothetical protein
MNYAPEKLRRIIVSLPARVPEGTLLAMDAVIVLLVLVPILALSDAASSAVSSFLQLVWDQLSTPSPPMPAGDLTMQLLKTWALYVVEVKFPRLREIGALRGWSYNWV